MQVFCLFLVPGTWRPKMGDYRDSRDNATIILACSNVRPFKWRRNIFGCPSCNFTSPDFNGLSNHMSKHPLKSNKLDILRQSRPGDTVKADVTDLKCDLCKQNLKDLPTLMDHLLNTHNKPIITNYDSGIAPYLLNNGFTCAVCGESFERFAALHSHAFDHFSKSVCSECGMHFAGDRLRKHMLRIHENTRQIKLDRFKLGEYDARQNASIILEYSNVCPFKWRRNVFGCAYCPYTSPDFVDLRNHMFGHSIKADRIKILRNSRPTHVFKADVSDMKCDICQEDIDNLTSLMDHLKDEHERPLKKEYGAGITPYLLKDSFKCAYSPCSEIFDCFIKLNTHVLTHNVKYTCSICGQNFSCKDGLRNHTVRTHRQHNTNTIKLVPKYSKSKARWRSGFYDDARHNAAIIVQYSNACPFKWHRNAFGCANCDYTSAEFGLIKSHVLKDGCRGLRYARPTDMLKAEVTDLKCNLCDQSFTDVKTLLYHLGENHNKTIKKEHGHGIIPYLLNDNYSCADCGIEFDRFNKLNCHMNQHYANYVCSICGEAFTNSARLRHHTWQHKASREKVKIKCSACELIFETRYEKQKHMQSKHGLFPHKCPYCTEVFTTYTLRVEHLNDAHGKKIDYPCNMCPEVFKSASRRSKHIRYFHIKDKEVACSICEYRCISVAQLRRHMIRHGGERKYKCEVCKKAYPRKGALALHMRIHNNDKRFVCDHCNCAFVQKCSLTSHMKTHHPYDN